MICVVEQKKRERKRERERERAMEGLGMGLREREREREEKMREEVMYLHSLWHQGPPPPPTHNLTHNHANTSFFPHHSPPPKMKMKMKNSRLKGLKKKKMKQSKKSKKLPPSSNFEWPVPQQQQQPSSSSGWPVFKAAKTKPVPLPTAEEQTLLDGMQLQHKALQFIKQFFTQNEDSDGCIDSDDDDDDDTMDEDGNADYNCLIKLFDEDEQLRSYYQKNKDNGQFNCLVCGGLGDNLGKRFKHCVSLVQHSLTIAKTKKKKAHRAFSQVVCKVLGWDINKLPTPSDHSKQIVEAVIDGLTNNDKESALDKDSDVIGDSVMSCEGHPAVSIGNISISKVDALLGSNVEICETNLKENDVGQFVGLENRTITDHLNGDMMLCESSEKINNADTCVENIENSGVVHHLSRDVAKMTMLAGK